MTPLLDQTAGMIIASGRAKRGLTGMCPCPGSAIPLLFVSLFQRRMMGRLANCENGSVVLTGLYRP